MRYTFAILSMVVLAAWFTVGDDGSLVEAAPEWQLPWPTTQQHRISGGNTYNCGTHTTDPATSGSAYNADKYAVDFQFTLEQPASGVASGTIFLAGNYNDGYGNKVVIDHDGGFTSTYAHLNSLAVSQGVVVSQGQLVGGAGGSGGYPVHLHMHIMLGLSAHKPEPMSTLVNGFGQYGYSKDDGTCDYDGDSPYWASLVPWVRNLPSNPSFETGSTSPWQTYEPAPTTEFQLYNNGTAKSGSWFMQFNTVAQNGSVYQDITTEVPSTGDSYVFSIWARTPSAAICVDVKTALWAIGGTPESGSNTFNSFCGTTWRLLTTSLDVANPGHTALRAQVYIINLNGIDNNENLDLDAADVTHVKNKNASFERWTGTAAPDWNRMHPQNGTLQWAQQPNGASGGFFLQANKTSGNTASIYQDIPIMTTPGESYQFSVYMKRNGSGNRYAHIAIWGLDANPESVATSQVNLTTTWTLLSVTLNIANAGHNKLRAEIYLDTGGCYARQLRYRRYKVRQEQLAARHN